jgi:hypothetical protein
MIFDPQMAGGQQSVSAESGSGERLARRWIQQNTYVSNLPF